ncbi:serine/threonine-protein kinase Chk1-like [Oratosquilla oratoria]|uniref:serine/threonine-protein kinase Chk1-like n=1 Tax=Oratosquilla oratoria TaxID=337810 RepID=UPI003F764350
MCFWISCCRKVAENRQIVQVVGRWVSIARGLKRLSSAFRKCACQKAEGQTPGSAEYAPTTPVTKKPDSKILLVQEAVIHVQLKHENIVKVVCWTETDSKVFLFMEFCSGGSLLKAIVEKVPQEDVGQYFSQLMSAIDYLHCRGVVHRDLKPGNLLLTEKKVLKVADLGLASVFIVKGKEVEVTGLVGTKPYMAPEIFRSWKYAGPPTDFWSCGVILFNMVTNDCPWRIAHLQDPSYKRWVEKGVALDPKVEWKITKFCWRTYVKALLSPDPVERLFSWRTTLTHHLRAISETTENSSSC